MAGNITVEVKKPIIIVNSTTRITTRLSLHIPLPAMSPAAEEELTCRNPLKPNGISTLWTTFYRAMRCMCPKMEANLTSLRASTTNTGSCKQLSRSSLHHLQPIRRAHSQPQLSAKFLLLAGPPLNYLLQSSILLFGSDYLSLSISSNQIPDTFMAATTVTPK
jgi:hypothetical protein